MALLFLLLSVFVCYSLKINVEVFQESHQHDDEISFDGENITFVSDIRHKIICKRGQTSPHDFLLYFNGKQLKEKSTLNSCGIIDNSTLLLVPKRKKDEYEVQKHQKDIERKDAKERKAEYYRQLISKHESKQKIKRKYDKIAARKYNEIEGRNERIKQLFDDFNDLFFMSMLSHIDIKWYDHNDDGNIIESSMNECAGIYKIIPPDWSSDKEKDWEIREVIRLSTVKKQDIFSQLLHEMIHAYLRRIGVDETSNPHGLIWEGIASIINEITGLNITPYHELYDAVRDAESQHTESDESHDTGDQDNEYFKMLFCAIICENEDEDEDEDEDDNQSDTSDDSDTDDGDNEDDIESQIDKNHVYRDKTKDNEYPDENVDDNVNENQNDNENDNDDDDYPPLFY